MELLAELEGAIPGESADYYPSTSAQDCFICADTAIRLNAEPGLAPGRAIWYAIEPQLQASTMRLFGVTELGTSPDEETREQAILNDEQMAQAIDFITAAVSVLAPSEPDGRAIETLRPLAAPLMPS